MEGNDYVEDHEDLDDALLYGDENDEDFDFYDEEEEPYEPKHFAATIRHGQSADQVIDAADYGYQNKCDPPLTPQGMK